MTRINTILIANRGEIACRIIRTVQAGGRRAIAVYSDADADAPHVAQADQAVPIGPAPASDSYLNIAAIVAAAEAAGADAIHPGYGFLSENAAFARACDSAGLVFIGPGADAIDLMGNKAAAKRHMLARDVPCVPGYEGDEQSDQAFATAAADIGYPLMIKASAGGGGRGMRTVEDADALLPALAMARAEAEAAFGSPELILERAIVDARHVEVQIIADQHDNIVHLGERDCSVQRRHQKVVEESPCPAVDAELRARLGAAAISAASGIGYRGAGTVEFLLDASGEFYFLEMNTRLQVEHPVTEMITGLDLVALQIDIAQGTPLPFGQDDIEAHGHAIEVRLYAEDPAQSFLPQTGHISHWQAAPEALARTDGGIASGQTISPYYDPMLAKIIACGDSRDDARRRLIDALGQTAILGLTTNRDFLIGVLAHPVFADGHATTVFLTRHATDFGAAKHDAPSSAAAAVICYRRDRQRAMNASYDVGAQLADWSSDASLCSRFEWADDDGRHALTVRPLGGDRYHVSNGVDIDVIDFGEHRATLATGNVKQDWHFAIDNSNTLHLAGACATLSFSLAGSDGLDCEGPDDGSVYAPMHGRVAALHVEVGDIVTRGQRLAVIEAMKMQHEITANSDGTVRAIHAQQDTQIAADALLISLEVAE